MKRLGLLQFVVLSALVIAAVAGCAKKADDTASQTAQTASPEATATVAATATAQSAAASTPAAATTPVPSPSGSPDPLASVHFTDISGIYAEKAIKNEAVLGIFGTKDGKFDPYGPITRGDYVRWLVLANNAYFAGAQDQIRLAEPNSEQSFVDVPKSNPNFKYIQGLANAGYLVGIDKTHFAPDRKLTREELLAILINRDNHGSSPVSLEKLEGDTGLSDANKISKPYWGAIDSDHWSNIFGSSQSLQRVFGPVKFLHPQQLATRADAAIAISLIQTHSAEDAVKNGPR